MKPVEICWGAPNSGTDSAVSGPKFSILWKHVQEILLFMAALWNRAGHYIFALWFLLSFFFFLSFPRRISAIADWIIPYFHTWRGLSANLRCRSETCCTWVADNTGCKKIAKNSPSGHHRTTLSGYICATKARIDNQKKKLVKQQYLPNMSLQYGELRPTSSWLFR